MGIHSGRAALHRRRFLKTVSTATVGWPLLRSLALGQSRERPRAKIVDLLISDGVTISTDSGAQGSFAGSRAQDLGTLKSHLRQLRELLIGRDPLDQTLDGEMLWEAIFPVEHHDTPKGAILSRAS